jgi:hypothetical protein
MCSQNQPKMFGGASPLGSGGNFSAPVVYQSNPQPTSNASTPGAAAPAASPTTASPGMTTAQNPAASAQPNNPYLQWWQRNRNFGSLPTMGGSRMSPTMMR